MRKKLSEVNKDQKQFWSGKGGDIWVERQKAMDTMLSPLGEVVIKELNLLSKDKVLDIGCGCGSTSIDIAEHLSLNGAVTGVDISKPMLDRAKLSAKNKSLNNIDFQLKDVQSENLPNEHFSVAFSRFGVMFFENPFEAFSNIYRSLKAGGRLGFVCWQSPKFNPWQSLSIQAIRKYIELPSYPKRNPGPFAFQERSYIEEIISKANFKYLKILALEKEVEMFKGKGLEHATEDYLSINPVITEMLKKSTEEVKESVKNALISSFEPYYSDNKLTFPSSTWIVTAVK